MATQMTKVEVKGTEASRKMLVLGIIAILAALLVLAIAAGPIENRSGATANPAGAIVNNYRSFREEAAGMAEPSHLSSDVLERHNAAINPAAGPFDYEAAAELSAMRWEAMARFYEDNGLLAGQGPVNEPLYPKGPITPWEYNHGQ